ncbi:MAG TPA: CbtA family protein [Nitrososphaera sp.]
MHIGRSFGLSILAGLVASGVLVGINVALVQPYTAALAEIELENLLAMGEFDEEEFDAQLQSIYFSQLYGSIIIGLAAGALVGGVFVVGKIRKTSPLKAALLIAGIAWFVLYVIPTAKYPPSPAAAFDPEVAGTYQGFLAGYTTVSALAALGITFGFRNVRRKEKALAAAALYLMVVAGAFLAFPAYQSEDDSLLPLPLLSAWRSAISLSMTVFWFVLGITCGLLWTYGSKSD